MTRPALIAGTGMIPFVKPGASETYPIMGSEAARLALADAGVRYDLIEHAYVGFIYGDSTSGQAALYRLGLTGIPIVNVNNNCSTGSTALYLARQAVASGQVECALALGFEQMAPGALGAVFQDRPTPLDEFLAIANRTFVGAEQVPMAIRLFAGAGKEYQDTYGASTRMFAEVRAKASRHAEHNDKAIFRKPLTADEVLASPTLFLNLTRLQACPPTCGAAAAVVCSEAFARTHGIAEPIRIAAQALTTDRAGSFDGSMIRAVGADMARDAASRVYEAAGIGPDEVDVVELHDCFTTNEVLAYEALGLCPEGGAEQFVADGDNTYGGRVVTNPSGGLLSKGHPIGATGLAQCHELVTQLRGRAGRRQVTGARIGLQHNLGLGGACVVTLFQKD